MPADLGPIDESIRPIWEAGGNIDPPPPGDMEAALAAALRARARQNGRAIGGWRRTPWSLRRVVAGSAVVVGLVIAVGLVGRSVGVNWIGTPGSWQTMVVPNGQRASLTLDDGTRVVINSGSRLRYFRGQISGSRRVYLDGEAYFTVVHDPRHPFTVHTKRMAMRDVGTAFNVQAYSDDEMARVAVVQGEVCVQSLQANASDATCQPDLRAHDIATLSDAQLVTTRNADAAGEAAWVQGGLVFTDVRLDDVARELSRTFDVTVMLNDSTLKRELVTGNFSHQPVDRILQTITAIIGAEYEQHGRHIVIRRRRTSGTTVRPPMVPRVAMSTAQLREVDP